MFRYRVFGFTVKSQLELPELRPLTAEDNVEADVQLRYGTVPSHLEQPVRQTPWNEVAKGEFLLKVDGIAQYYVKAGQSISIQADPAALESDIRVFLYKTVFAQLCYQRGLFVLHSASFVVENQAVLLMGTSGTGKSALAFHLLQQGYEVIGDELCALQMDEGKVRLLPGVPYLSVWHDTFTQVGVEPSIYQTLRDGIQKYIVPLGNERELSKSVAQIVFLKQQKENDIKVEVIQGFRKFQDLMKQVYHIDFSEAGGQKEKSFVMSTQLANQAELLELSYNERIHGIDEVAKELLEKVRNQ